MKPFLFELKEMVEKWKLDKKLIAQIQFGQSLQRFNLINAVSEC